MGATEQHQRRSIRLKEYDYASVGAYFVTLVTHGRECLLGEIREDEVVLNPTGMMVQGEWERLAMRFPQVDLDEFVIMPNHVHGVIVIKEDGAAQAVADSDPGGTSLQEGAAK